MAIRANLKVDDRKVSTRRTDAIPNATDRVDKWVELSVVHFAADTPNIDVDDVGGGIEVEIPNVLQQHSPRNHPPLIANQILKQLEFSRKQADIPATSASGPRY